MCHDGGTLGPWGEGWNCERADEGAMLELSVYVVSYMAGVILRLMMVPLCECRGHVRAVIGWESICELGYGMVT